MQGLPLTLGSLFKLGFLFLLPPVPDLCFLVVVVVGGLPDSGLHDYIADTLPD